MSDSEQIKALQQEVALLRQEIDEVDDWANGIQLVLEQVLPLLLEGHPKGEIARELLRRTAARYEQLAANPALAEDEHERIGLYESAKILNAQLTLIEQARRKQQAPLRK